MAVYTRITEQELQKALDAFDIGTLTGFEGISDGVENSNYHLFTNKNGTARRYILTLFEKRVNAEELPFYLGYMRHLRTRGIDCHCCTPDPSGESHSDLTRRSSGEQQHTRDSTALPDTRTRLPSVTALLHRQSLQCKPAALPQLGSAAVKPSLLLAPTVAAGGKLLVAQLSSADVDSVACCVWLTCISQQHHTQLGGSQVAHKIHGTDPAPAKAEAAAEAHV